jgi:F-type H+-transporting ATPase subunit f
VLFSSVPHTLFKKLFKKIMSAIFRRAYTTKTLIPPNVAAATRLSGSAKDGQITQLVDFYKVQKKRTEKKRKEKKQSAEY